MARTKKTKNSSENMQVQTMEEWLAQGNKITICPPGMRSEEVVTKFNGGRGRKKKAAAKKKTD
jgi:predicted phosphoadenosine phosphosulfate sulfurtransferase